MGGQRLSVQTAQHRDLQPLHTRHTAAAAGLHSRRRSARACRRFVTFEDDSAVDQVFGGGPMHEISGKKVEVKAATPRGSGPQGRGPQPPGPFLRPMPATGLPSRFPGLQGQLGQQVGAYLEQWGQQQTLLGCEHDAAVGTAPVHGMLGVQVLPSPAAAGSEPQHPAGRSMQALRHRRCLSHMWGAAVP